MDNINYTIEDSLEYLVGLRKNVSFQLDSSDVSFLQSIARQTFKGTALTDRQCNVVKEKLLKYKDQFLKEDYNIDYALDYLRMPLREIDRSKYVTIVYYADVLCIKIRFPFSKNLISKLESVTRLVNRNDYFHEKGSHEHYFRFNERSIFEIVSKFQSNQFVIDQDIIDIYEKLVTMNNNKNEYIPGVYNLKLKNLSDIAKKYIFSSIGEPTIENLALYKDRQQLFGLHHFDENDLNASLDNFTTLSTNIVNRTSCNVFVNNTKYTLQSVAESLLELNRFPLLVVLSEDSSPLDQLYSVYHCLNGFIEKGDSTVLFRLDNDKNFEFNNFIKKYNLNSPLDKNTKVVYISINNITKPLLKSEWKASATLLMSSHKLISKVKTYVDESDLIIHYDENVSQYARFNEDGIQEV